MTLKQLIAHINSALETWPEGSVDKLNERTCYFYRNQGLLDVPLQVGPFAQYGSHHARQLLSIKGLQRAGKSLAEIKAALNGRTDDQLTDLLTSLGISEPRTETKGVESNENGNGHDSIKNNNPIRAVEKLSPSQKYIQIEPWGTLQLKEEALRPQPAEWSHYPLTSDYTLIGAPGAPSIPDELLRQIQTLLRTVLPKKPSI